jgi:hypothetical protein
VGDGKGSSVFVIGRNLLANLCYRYNQLAAFFEKYL